MMINTKGQEKLQSNNCVIENTNSSTKDWEREKRKKMVWNGVNKTIHLSITTSLGVKTMMQIMQRNER